jgi:hypothetical protein
MIGLSIADLIRVRTRSPEDRGMSAWMATAICCSQTTV